MPNLRRRGAGSAPCLFARRMLWRLALVLAVSVPLAGPGIARAESRCEVYRITGYIRGHHSPWTYDGTSVWTREPIAAASWNVPIGAIVKVDGLGKYRVADRGGGLGARHIDILVDSYAEAYAVTGARTVCIEDGPTRSAGKKKPKPKVKVKQASVVSCFVAVGVASPQPDAGQTPKQASGLAPQTCG